MKIKKLPLRLLATLLAAFASVWTYKHVNLNTKRDVGQEVDRFNGVIVYYNGGVGE